MYEDYSKNPKATECGYWQGCKVTAATDAWGPQVIVANEEHTVHLISACRKDHVAAEDLGYEVVERGPNKEDGWMGDWVEGGSWKTVQELFCNPI